MSSAAELKAWGEKCSHLSDRGGCGSDLWNQCDGSYRETTGNPENLKEELGDLLLQVVMQSQIAKEEGLFTLDDVVKGITEKMILRHPHVFGNAGAENSEQVLVNWDEIKKQEKTGKADVREYLAGAFAESERLIGKARERKGL